MTTPDGDACIPKIANCIVSEYAQPLDAFGEETLRVDYEINEYICPHCLPGYFWDDSSPVGVQSRCEPCGV